MKRALIISLLVAASGAALAGAKKEPPPQPGEKVISVIAKKFEFTPSTIELKVGEPTVLEFKTTDRRHGFEVPGLKLSAVIKPGPAVRVRVTADKEGEFSFHCSVFCGSGHEDMGGKIVVKR